jgi:glycosyltransferase involved in cell wall biosynthesis
MPLISVIMASYNHEKYIPESIESVLDQSFNDLELIIIDDTSKDNSRKVIEKYSKVDPRVRLVFHEKNLGIAKTFNEGIQLSKGKFIAFLASDDVWTVDKLKKQMEILEKDENVIVWTEGEIINDVGQPVGKKFTDFNGGSNRKKSGHIFNDLMLVNYIFGSSLVLKRDNLKDIRFDEGLKYLNDYLFYLDLSVLYDYHFIDESLVKYRIHGNNAIFSNKKEWYLDMIKVNDYVLNKYHTLINKYIKTKILCYNVYLCYTLGDVRASLDYLIKGIKLSPLNVSFVMVSYMTKRHA